MIQWYWKVCAAAACLASVTAWGYVQGRDAVQAKWDEENATVATALAVAFEKSAKETEAIRGVFVEYKAKSEAVNADLEHRVADGSKRLRVAARCLPSSTDASRTGAGTAELDTTARQDYYALRRGIDEQRGLLNLCRAELKKRSIRTE